MNTNTDREFDTLEPFLDILRDWESKTKVYIMNPKRALEMQKTRDRILKSFRRRIRRPSPKWLPCPLQTGSASIVITCDFISIENIPEFLWAIARADSFSVDCLNNRKLRIMIGFNHVFELVDCF